MKRKVLTLSDKSDIIKKLESGESVTNLAKKYGIAKSTVCLIKKNRINILNTSSECYGLSKRKTLKTGRSRNFSVTSELLKVKAKSLHGILKEKEHFNASDDWLQKFKRRFGIRFLKISGEKLSTNPELVPPFQENLRSLIARLNLTDAQIYNADEADLFWKLLPEKTLVRRDEKTAPGRKSEKVRLTFLACTNATGDHKIKPLVIGKAKRPRSFTNFSLPVDYDYSKKGWMTCTIFENWFHKCFVPQVEKYLDEKKLPLRAMLLLDNAPSYPIAEKLCSKDGNIFVKYTPPNVTVRSKFWRVYVVGSIHPFRYDNRELLTPLIQPMDQNVIRLTTLYYRSSLLSTIVSSKYEDISKVLKELTIKDAIISLSIAWNRVEAETIRKCWRNILNFREHDDDSDSENDVPLSLLKERYKNKSEETIEEVKNLLTEINSQVSLSTDDIQNWNKDDINEQDTRDTSDDAVSLIDEGDDDGARKKIQISASEAVDAFNKVIAWSEENIFEINDLLVLKKCRDKALHKSLSAKKIQKYITVATDTKRKLVHLGIGKYNSFRSVIFQSDSWRLFMAGKYATRQRKLSKLDHCRDPHFGGLQYFNESDLYRYLPDGGDL
ncbi:jerky protein homolog-like [Euwallacea similis]|uniref:jerky protein homolog-like n=1 Tax=Euwallacea similis TaxID=1736056 RepID=UPI00344C8EFC